jgi:hypothetical protein
MASQVQAVRVGARTIRSYRRRIPFSLGGDDVDRADTRRLRTVVRKAASTRPMTRIMHTYSSVFPFVSGDARVTTAATSIRAIV